jgi:hypothetical protein
MISMTDSQEIHQKSPGKWGKWYIIFDNIHLEKSQFFILHHIWQLDISFFVVPALNAAVRGGGTAVDGTLSLSNCCVYL